MTDSFTWLHLSDLHWGHAETNKYWRNSIEGPFLDDIVGLKTKEKLHFDVIFFTGDLVQDGKAANYEGVDLILDRLKEKLKADNPIFLSVPGNHDLVRKDKNDPVLKDFISGWKKHKDKVWNEQSGSTYKDFITESFSDYTKWASLENKIFPLPITGYTKGLLPGDFAYTCTTKGERKIGIMGLNTSFLQVADRNYKGKLEVNVAQVDHLFPGGKRSYECLNEHDVCLLLTHHPVDWLSEQGKEEMEEHIAPAGKFQLHLCGHMHGLDYIAYKKHVNSPKKQIVQNYSLFSKLEYYNYEEREKLKVRQHGYMAGTILFEDIGICGKIFPRKYVTGNRFIADTEMCETDKNYFSIKVEEKRKSTKPVISQKAAEANSVPVKNSVSKDMVKPAWCTCMDHDSYGLYADFTLKGVTQRLRWIEPGEFLMGSPESEPERDADEYQHKVVLTDGFWIGDTVCTQELWEAVMGENPSRLKGSQLPVENVDWDTCHVFIDKLNKLKPGLDLRLPTEAEWEYSCRAGTTTSFWFGDNITTEQVNYNGDSPYNKGKKGIYRKTTVEVKSLPCNSWGLYQMHGNVWEWCSDWYDENYYKKSPIENPIGPLSGKRRVMRGGRWRSYGKDVRSAQRYRKLPFNMPNDIGFRLARGQKKQAVGYRL